MAEVKPFHALRYDLSKAGNIEDLTCPPYDIISEEQREAYLRQNPYNVIRLELPRGEDPYREAGSLLKDWLSQGILKRDMEPGFYIYEEEFWDAVDHGEKKKLKGLVALVRVEDFSTGVVLPHEETLSKAKTDRLNLMKATNCNFSQIYSLYQDEAHITRNRLENLSKTCPPRYEFSDGLVTHRLWVVNDTAAIEAIREDFSGRKLYIADGHHRYETAINYRNWCREEGRWNPGSEYVMMMLCDMADEGLVVFPTHRLVRGLPDFQPQTLLKACEEEFFLTVQGGLEETKVMLDTLYREEKHAFGFYDGSAWTVLTLKDPQVMARVLPEKSQASRLLDVSILHSLILEKFLGIDKENMANQKNLTYTRSMEEAKASVEQGESCCCFLLNPTRVSEIGEVAANGEKMPQKSTYFYPKLITGLAMNALDDC